jgi:hypothetical protein
MDQNIFEQIRKTPPPSPEELGRLLGISSKTINSALSRGILSKEDENLAKLILSVYEGKQPASMLTDFLALSPAAALSGSTLSDRLQAIVTSGSVDPKLIKTADGAYDIVSIMNAGTGGGGLDEILNDLGIDLKAFSRGGNVISAEKNYTATKGILDTLTNLAKKYPGSKFSEYLNSVKPKLESTINQMSLDLIGVTDADNSYISDALFDKLPELKLLEEYRDKFRSRLLSGGGYEDFTPYRASAEKLVSSLNNLRNKLTANLESRGSALPAETKARLESILSAVNSNLGYVERIVSLQPNIYKS